jgi:hypothetical protein
MPADLDYAWLGEFIAHPPRWSEEDLAIARTLLENQRRALEETDPRDRRHRPALEDTVNALQEAIDTRG